MFEQENIVENKVEIGAESKDCIATNKPKNNRLLYRLWRGEIELWQAFWLFGLLGRIIITMLNIYFESMVENYEEDVINYISQSTLTTIGWISATMAMLLLEIIYSLLLIVGIWRSATKYQGAKFLALSAKIIIIIAIFRSISIYYQAFIDQL